jgi:adenylate cyclase
MANRYGPRGFTAADCRVLRAIGSQIDTAIYERSEIRLLRQILGRALDPRVMNRLLASPDVDFLKGELLEVTVLYTDIRGATQLAENTEPELFVDYIKDYLSHMTDVILKHEGTVDKFLGDGVMALFGAPVPQDDHALRAVRVALDMQVEYQAVRKHWQERRLDAPPIGVGIATGPIVAGEMGGPHRANYTVIGRAANLGARICGVAAGGQVLICQRTYDLIKDRIEAIPVPGQKFKGVGDNITVYHVTRVWD